MPAFSMTKNWDDGTALTESQLDDIKTSVETFLNVTKLDSDNIQTGGISTAALATNAVTTIKITDLNVTTGKINDLAVTTGKINDLAVTTAKIDDLGVTTGKIAAGAVTQAKRASLDEVLSSSSGNFTMASTSYTDVTNLSCASVVTTGRRVVIALVPDGDTTNVARIAHDETLGASGNLTSTFKLVRDSTDAGLCLIGSRINSGVGGRWAPGEIVFTDKPAAGTYTYKIQAKMSSAGTNLLTVDYCKLLVYEL